MTSQKIGIDLVFKANTQSAATNINQLNASLQQIVNKQFTPQISDVNIRKAAQAAQDLSRHLDVAINTDTGKLDLVKFNNSLSSAGQNLNSLTSNLLKAGKDGEQAFVKLSRTISTAQAPVFKMQGMVGKLWMSLKNVATWQISSKMLMGLTSGISSAYRFAQDLNESLNNIRIVTGKSAEEMEKFADKANKAAKALSTTTTKYTDAALIFFQQGLSEKKAIERTNTTIKLANITGQSVEEISNQLTAIWNNFDNGTKPLEYYADVITALGAATASSSKEISEGLEKFAAVGETVGLSYEYATAALATVTATTRQSADVVGTAFKTLFARIQDLELGNTLDDGTTLGQYSQALEAVGINIKNANGEVKDMNIIFDEMGAKWGTLNKDAQIALAQNVAGVRQYTQLMALMENYDFFKENLKIAEQSSGTLQEQADIYAESWKAARDEVTAALEDIYMDLLDDDFFIDFLKGLADIINSLDYFIEQIGGLGPLFIQVGSIFLSAFAHKVGPALSNLVTQFQLLRTAGTQKIVEKVTEPHIEQVDAQLKDPNAKYTAAERQSLNFDKDNIAMRAKLTLKSSKMSESEKQGYEAELARNQQLQDWIIKRIEKSSELTRKKEEELKVLQEQVKAQQILVNTEQQRAEIEAKRINAQKIVANEKGIEYDQKQLTKTIKERTAYEQKMAQEGWSEQQKQADEYYQRLLAEEQRYKQNIVAREKVRAQLTGHTRKKVTSEEAFQVANSDTKQANSLQQQTAAAEKGMQAYKKLRMEQAETAMATNKTASETDKLIASLDKIDSGASDINTVEGATQFLQEKLSTLSANDLPSLKRALELLGQTQGVDMIDQDMDNLVNSSATAQQEIIELKKEIERLTEAANKNKNSFDPKHTAGKMEAITSAASGLASAASALQSLGAAVRSLQDESVEPTQRMMNFMTSFVMAAPSVIFAFKGLWNAIFSGHPVIAGVTLAITGLTGIIAWLVISQEKEKTAAEKAAEAHAENTKALEALNEQLSTTKEKLEEVKSTFEKYIELENSFDKLIEGSTAYNETLQEQAELVRKLIEEYPQLLEYGFVDPITNKLNNQAQALVEGMATIDYLQAQISSTFAHYDTERSREEKSYTQKIEDFDNDSNWEELYSITHENTTDDKLVFQLGQGKTARSWELERNILNPNFTETDLVAAFQDIIYNDLDDGERDMEHILAAFNQGGEYSYLFGEQNFKRFEAAMKEGFFPEEYLNELAEINQEHEKNLTKINKQQEAAFKSLANSINSSIKGYSELNDLQKNAADAILADRMMQFEKNFDYSLDDGWKNYSEAFKLEMNGMLERAGLSEDDWDYSTDVDNNIEDSEMGTLFLNEYLSQQGYNPADIESTKWKDNAVKLEIDGEEIEASYKAIMEAGVAAYAPYMTDAAFEGLYGQAKNLSNQMAAALSGQIQSLTEDEILDIADYDKASGTYTVKGEFIDQYEQKRAELELSEDNVNDVVEAIKNYDAALSETMRKQADLQKGNALIATEAEKYDLDTETLERYAKSLQQTGKMSYEAAAKMAVANAKMSKGVEGLRDKLDDVIGTLKNYDTTSYEFAEAAAEISESLSLMFGADVSNELIKQWADNGDLEKLAAGGQEAVETFERLQLAVGQDYVTNLSIDESYKDQFKNLLTELQVAAKNGTVELDITAGGQEALDSLNKLLEAGDLTVEQVQAMFDSIGWTPNIEYKPGPITETANWTGTGTVGEYGKKLSDTELSWNYVVTKTETQIPVIGDVDNSGNKNFSYSGKSTSSLRSAPKSSGSGGSKKKDKNQEIERYHEITQKLEDLNREYDRLGKLKDRAFGQSHLDYLDLESKKLDEVIEGEKEYIRQIEEKLALDKEALAKYGVSFDESGRITNYDEVYIAQIDQYNTNPEAYEESYSKFTEEMSQYEDSLNLLEDKEEELFDKQNERFDKSLEKAEYVVEYGTSLVEDSLSIIEYQLEKIEDKAYSTAEALALMGQKMNEVSKKSGIYKESIEVTLAASGLSIDDILGASPEELAELVANGTFTAEQVEQLRNYRDELLNTNQEMKDMANETLDKLLEGFDELNEAVDKNKEKIDHLKEVTSSYRDIIDLIGKDNFGVNNQILEQMNEFNIVASQSQVDITRRQLEENKRSLEKAREEYRNAASEEEKYYWGQVVESLEETVMQGESDLLSATQDSLNTIQNAFKDTLTNITEEFEKAISGMYSSLETLQTAYDQRTDERERYLEDYAKIYELSKLTRDINKSMDESDSIRGKQRLLEIQEEINALQESGVEMTQFEVDELRARYDLRLAEIALEEAQNAKSQVRMTRDSEGNWSYTYTADQDAIDNAQQNYEDKLYAYQNLTTEYIYDLESQILAIPEELSAALQAIWEDTTLTDEEKETRAQEAIDFYVQKDAFLKEQMEKAIGRSKELYDKDWKNYSNATGYKISADEQWMDSFNETVLSQITGFKTLEEYQQIFADSAMTMANDMRAAYQTMTSNIDKTLQNMGTSMTTFAQDLQGLMNANKQRIEEYTKEVDDDIEKMGTSSADAMKKAADNWALYAGYVANSAGANENLATAINNVITAIGGVSAPLDDLSKKYEELERDAKAAAAAIANLNGTGPNGNPSCPVCGNYPCTCKKEPQTIDNDPSGVSWYGGIMDISLSRPALSGANEPIMTKARYSTLEFKNVKANTYQVSVGGTILGYTDNKGFKKLKQLKEESQSYIDTKMNSIGLPSGFDTGGYTGSWDSSGRLAMLHQKELVLNADDTKNFLAAVNIVRDISSAIDLRALAYQNALGQMRSAMIANTPQTIQQDVTIHAEFPNATERNEIEAAFNSLMNQATQYVHRK